MCSAKRIIKKGEQLTAAFFIDDRNPEALFDRVYAGSFINFLPEKRQVKLDMRARRLFREHDWQKKWCEELRGVKLSNYKIGLEGLVDKNGVYKQLPYIDAHGKI